MTQAIEEALDEWFVREIVAHEAALTRFLVRVWRDAAEIPDLRQEAYVRVYEAARRARPLSPKSFLFTTARHLMTDRARRRIVRIELVEDLDALNVLVDDISPECWLSARQELRQLSVAFDRLPHKCRDVMWMRRVEELPQREIAARLGVSESTVEKHVARGVRLLADDLHGHGRQTLHGQGPEKCGRESHCDEQEPLGVEFSA